MIVILLVGFLGVAAADWTILPNIAWIRRARAETEQLLQCAADAILIADEEGVVGAANAAAEQLLSNRALIGRNILEIIALDCVTVEKDFHELAGRAELTVRQAGGVAVSVEATVSRPPDGGASRQIFILRDISGHTKLRAQLERNALFDSLTQLPNRASFTDRLRRALARSAGRDEANFAVMFLDVLLYSWRHNALEQPVVGRFG